MKASPPSSTTTNDILPLPKGTKPAPIIITTADLLKKYAIH